MESFIETLAAHEPNTSVFIIPMLIVLNFILGTSSAFVNEKFSARKCIHGIIRYLCIWLFVMVFDYVMYVYHYNEIFVVAQTFIVFSIIMNVIKHYKQLGGPLPEFMEKFIIGKMAGMQYLEEKGKAIEVDYDEKECN